MAYTIGRIAHLMQQLAPLALQADYDNAGLLTGAPETTVTGILCSLDCTEQVVAEAVARGCNLIVCHHPIIFKGLKQLTGAGYVQRTIIAAIQANVGIYAAHTNLDSVFPGVNTMLAGKLNLQNVAPLQPAQNALRVLVTFVPFGYAAQVRQALFNAGAGQISNYSHCSYNLTGTGTFLPGTGSHPQTGTPGKLEEVSEIRIETVFHAHLESRVTQALLQAHPYEEPAFNIYPIHNKAVVIGSGAIGTLPQPLTQKQFLATLKTALNTRVIKYTPIGNTLIHKVAVCGGAGSFLIQHARQAGAQAYVTADVKYHEFFDSEGSMLLADVGHFESEEGVIGFLQQHLLQACPQLPVHATGISTNPVSYYT